MTLMSPTGRHVTAAEALKFGLVDQITDHNTVNVAVKFAQRVAGEMWMKGGKRSKWYSLAYYTLSLHWFKN